MNHPLSTRLPIRLSKRLSIIRIVGATLLALLFMAPASFANEPDPPFMKSLYPPQLVMQNHRAINLSRDQRKIITEAIQATQTSTLELSWSMQDAASDLTREMEKPKIDGGLALEAAEKVMAIEGQVKRAHLGLLIKIKNTLSLEQQTQLDVIRATGE